MNATIPAEAGLMNAVLRLFPEDEYWRFEQVPLGRKKIDLVMVERRGLNNSISVELKVQNWRKALWQAAANLQLAHKSYIGIWHAYAHRAVRGSDLLRQYGVGLISVAEHSAEILIESIDSVHRISRESKRYWYQALLNHR